MGPFGVLIVKSRNRISAFMEKDGARFREPIKLIGFKNNCSLDLTKFTWTYQISDAYDKNDEATDVNILALAWGRERRIIYYPGYNINGFRFHTRDRDENKKTQNCGVMVIGEGNNGESSYYGVILDIYEGIKLHYLDVVGMILLGKVLVIQKIIMGLLVSTRLGNYTQ
ncbi:putative beta-galactosidase [Dioscorea sansibarensis]